MELPNSRKCILALDDLTTFHSFFISWFYLGNRMLDVTPRTLFSCFLFFNKAYWLFSIYQSHTKQRTEQLLAGGITYILAKINVFRQEAAFTFTFQLPTSFVLLDYGLGWPFKQTSWLGTSMLLLTGLLEVICLILRVFPSSHTVYSNMISSSVKMYTSDWSGINRLETPGWDMNPGNSYYKATVIQTASMQQYQSFISVKMLTTMFSSTMGLGLASS